VAFFGAAVTKTSGPFFQNARGAPKFRFSSAKARTDGDGPL
jgi:hypothetical protein